MRVEHIFETILYADDLEAAEHFYSRVLGLEVVQSSDIIVAFRCKQGVLLIFDPENSGKPGRSVPSHGCKGPGHVAFAVRDEELDSWRLQLAENEVEIEAEVEWNSGGRSIYFRDPAGNSLELVSPTLWGGGWEV
jgi:catechol 2,3-dioxygenase-like lactoylglutathione lyase family enzyme